MRGARKDSTRFCGTHTSVNILSPLPPNNSDGSGAGGPWTSGTEGKKDRRKGGRRTKDRVQYRDNALERRAHAGPVVRPLRRRRNATGTTIIDLSDGRMRRSTPRTRGTYRRSRTFHSNGAILSNKPPPAERIWKTIAHGRGRRRRLMKRRMKKGSKCHVSCPTSSICSSRGGRFVTRRT